MITRNVLIPIGDAESVSGILSAPEHFDSQKTTGVILAHGAANDMNNPLIQFVSRGLAGSGYVTLRFNFLYKEKGKKDQLRDAHLYTISIPMLFLAGTRDTLCDLNILKTVLDRLKAPWDLQVIDGGDHSFRLPKSHPVSQEDTYAQILKAVTSWL